VPGTQVARRRRISDAVKEVALELGNTPSVARASYIDPRLFDRYEEGFTIGGALADAPDGDLADPAFRDTVEAAVLRLLEDGRPELAAA
jgi:DNA topoisomerase IB